MGREKEWTVYVVGGWLVLTVEDEGEKEERDVV